MQTLKEIFLPLCDMAHDQCCCFQTTGAWHFFYSLYKVEIKCCNNSFTTAKVCQKCYAKCTSKHSQTRVWPVRHPSQILLIHLSHVWSLRLEIIHLPGKERKNYNQGIKPLKSYRSTTAFAIPTMATYLGCDASLGIQLHESPKTDHETPFKY